MSRVCDKYIPLVYEAIVHNNSVTSQMQNSDETIQIN